MFNFKGFILVVYCFWLDTEQANSLSNLETFLTMPYLIKVSLRQLNV